MSRYDRPATRTEIALVITTGTVLAIGLAAITWMLAAWGQL